MLSTLSQLIHYLCLHLHQTLPAIYVYIPDFITPNGDGINDDFDLSLEPTYRVELKLYSRWGNLVYQSDDYQNNFPLRLS